jgi:hypothetical protein
MIGDESLDRDGHLRQLRWSLQAIAESGSGQRALFPESAPSADALALEFDTWAEVVRTNYEADLTPPQRDALDAIERKLETMSRDGVEFDAELWTDAALAGSVHWAEVRALAAAALAAFTGPDADS